MIRTVNLYPLLSGAACMANDSRRLSYQSQLAISCPMVLGAWSPLVLPGPKAGLFVYTCVLLVFFPQFRGLEHEGCVEGRSLTYVFDTLAQDTSQARVLASAEGAEPGADEQSLIPGVWWAPLHTVIPPIAATVPEAASWHLQQPRAELIPRLWHSVLQTPPEAACSAAGAEFAGGFTSRMH